MCLILVRIPANIGIQFIFLNKDALHLAIQLLARREHSEKELIQKLQAKEHSKEDALNIAEHLIAKGYLSNERYAESMIRSRINKGYGWYYIEQELKQKGVESHIMRAALAEQNVDWYLQAELAYHKRFGEKAIVDQKDKAKRIRFLQYRGYAHDEIMAALKSN